MNQFSKQIKVLAGRVLVVLLLVVAQGAMANGYSNVAINGQVLTVEQLYVLQRQVGAVIAPGRYLVDQQGCWINLSTGASGCIASMNSYSRYGSGERGGDGSWNHYSDSADMGVGGTADGCIYTTSGWSNC